MTLEHGARMIRETGLHGPLDVLLRFEGIRGVSWIYFEGNSPRPGPASPLDDVAELRLSTSTEELMQGCEDADRGDAAVHQVLDARFVERPMPGRRLQKVRQL